MAQLLPTDEINNLRIELENAEKLNKDEIIDSVLDLLIMSYVFGVDFINEGFGKEIVPKMDKMESAIEKKWDGKGFRDRISEYVESGSVEDIMRVVDTDTHRVYEQAAYDTALEAGAKNKTWNVLGINTRDSHWYLDQLTIPIDKEFYTYKGHHTYYPGEFGEPDEDVNCRCWLTYS